jgi:hypothetical protein
MRFAVIAEIQLRRMYLLDSSKDVGFRYAATQQLIHPTRDSRAFIILPLGSD